NRPGTRPGRLGYATIPASVIEDRYRLVVRRLRYRRQIGVDIGEVLIRQDLLAIGRHLPVAAANEGRHGFERDRVGREPRAGHAALPYGPVTWPAAVLHERLLSLPGIGRNGSVREDEAGGERRQPHLSTTNTHECFPLARLRPGIDQRGLAGLHDLD